jgi:HlyD family secretion protein
LIALAAIAAASLGIYRYTRNTEPKVKYDTAALQRGKIVAKVTATGTLSAHVTVLVGSQVSGRIQGLFADFNSAVTKGQLLAQIDPQLFQASVAQARANRMAAVGSLAKSKAIKANAEIQYTRQKELLAKNLVAQADVDSARAAFESAEADLQVNAGSLAQADAQLHQAEVNLGYTKILSPVDGVVISRSVDIGQTVAAALQAPTLFTIAQDLHQMQVDTNVAESDVGKLSAGMTATFTVDAYPNERFKGKVREIRNAPQTIQSVVTYDAVIDVENPDLKLKPGMTANVTFVYAERDDVLTVANAALRFRPSPEALAAAGIGSAHAGGKGPHNKEKGEDASGPPPDRKVLWVLRNGALTRVVVRTGISDGTLTEIVGGELTDGDQLVLDANTGAPKTAPTSASTRGMGRIL